MLNWVNFKEIKEKVWIGKVLDHYGLLKELNRKGDNLVGACPIHKGTNTTQFHVSLAKNNFNCFGDCHGGGNVIDFVSKMENVDIREAGALIQEWFSIKPTKQQKKDEKESVLVHKEKEAEETKPEPAKEEIKENKPLGFELQGLDMDHPYLKERGLSKITIEEFGIGYCKKGIMEDRIAIPIHNEHGVLVGYIGRWLGDPPEGEKKYKLPTGFHKSLVLFNLHRARKSMFGHRKLIIVEGLFDCMKVWKAGYKNVVALIGSSMSDEQEELIKKTFGLYEKIILMFDADESGRKCTDDVLNRLAYQGYYVRVIKLDKEGSDPDSLSEEEIKELLR